LGCRPGVGRHLAGAVSISPNLDYIERAYDDAKYGNFSRQPYVDIIIPSMIDPDMAPPGKHVMSCFVQYAPTNWPTGSGRTPSARRSATRSSDVLELLPRHQDIILHRQVLTPVDVERITGITEGNIFHGELNLSQLFFLRPAPAMRSTARPSRATTSAAPAPTPAAASWARWRRRRRAGFPSPWCTT
jgi:phytoene dehydrogenase-like protein